MCAEDKQHKFDKTSQDWGFNTFCPLADVLNPAKGFLVNDTMRIHVEVMPF